MSQGPHGRAAEYLEGLLASQEERAFLEHLPECRECQEALEQGMLLREVEARVRSQGAAVLPLRPRRRWVMGSGLASLAAAAAALVLVVQRPGPVALALGPNRSIEGRVSYPGADAYRPYEQLRGGGRASVPGDDQPPEVLAALDRRGDSGGLVAAYVLSGDLSKAARALDRAPHTPDTDSDRALVLLSDLAAPQRQERLEEALALLDSALRAAPEHRPALWNRGLVLRELGLPFSAAASFRAVVALDPAWGGEALARAAALEGEGKAVRDGWWDALTAGSRMVEGKVPLSEAVARTYPGIARVYFHDAVRVAETRERLDALAPLARALDDAYGGEPSQVLARARAQPLEARRPLLPAYLDFVRGESLDDAGWRHWVAQAEKAGADDLVLGALVLTGRAGQERERLRQLVRATGSPWFEMLGAGEEAAAAFSDGDHALAERIATDALGRCDERRAAYRCLGLQWKRVQLHLKAHRLQAAARDARSALALARSIHEWGDVSVLHSMLGDVERLRSRLPQARAYYQEAAAETRDEACETRRDILLALAEVYVLEGRPDEARDRATSARTCKGPMTTTGLGVHVDLFRMGRPATSEESLFRAIGELRSAQASSPGEKAWADFQEGRLVIDRDRPRGERFLRDAIQAAAARPSDVLAAKAGSYAYTTLLVDAARRGAFEELAPLLVEERGAKPGPPLSCAVAAVRDDLRLAFAVHDARGQVFGRYEADARGPERVPPLPPELLRHLDGCLEVKVLAQPPLAGAPRLLPPQLPWSYQTSAGPRRPAAAGGAPRRMVVLGSKPPEALGLPPLADWDLPESARGAAVLFRGAGATPAHVLAELPSATEVQFHVHALTDRGLSDAPVLALTPDPDGRWALTAEAVRSVHLPRRPLVLLADCRAGELAEWVHASWGLPTAFLEAGARAVVASPEDVPDLEASRFFDQVAAKLGEGLSPAAAVSAVRREWLQEQPGSWATGVIVFE
jgi:cellulose synthase operon protein C